MKIKITSGFCIRPGVDVAPGDVVEASKHEALRAFAYGRAVPFTEEEPAASTEQSDAQPTALAANKTRAKWGRK